MAAGGVRGTSLPPLRPRSREEVAAAAAVVPMNLKKSRLLLDAASGKDWSQRPPRRERTRTEDLFRCLTAQGPSQGLVVPGGASRGRASPRGSVAGSLSPRSRDGGDGLRSDPSRATLATATATEGRSSSQGPPSSSSRPRRRRSSHLRAVKAAYIGTAAAGSGGYPGGEEVRALQERYRAMDAVLDAACGEAAEDRDARLRFEAAGIRTGEDAIKFFTKYGTDNTVDLKILYCNRPPAAGASDEAAPGPYDLVVVPADKVDAEHWTISANGVIHFRPGELSECTPLSEWMQQSLHYRVLASMNLFRFYPHRKALEQWRASTRHAAFCRSRQRLVRRCFLAKPMFVGPLMQARRTICKASNIQVLRIPDQCCQLSEFAEMQSACLGSVNGAQRQLENRFDELAVTLDKLLVAVGQAAAADSKPWDRASANSKNKAMVQEKQEAKEKARRLRVAKEDEALAGGCVQLVEHMLQAHLAEVLLSAAASLQRRLEEGSSPGEPPKKLFSVSAGLDLGPEAEEEGGRLVLRPPEEDFGRALRRVWADAVGAVDALPPLAFARALARHGLVPQASQRRVADVLAGHPAWLARTARAEAALGAALAEAWAFAKGELLGPCGRARLFGEEWSEATYVTKYSSFRSLSEDMQRVQKLIDDLSRCRCQRLAGPVFLDARRLRDGAVEAPEAALAAMKQVLASLARDRCAAACKRFDAVIKAVDDRPKEHQQLSVESYAATYGWAVQEQAALEELFEEVRSMYELLGQFSYRIALDDKVQLDGLLSRERDLTHRAMLEARLVLDRSRSSSRAAEAEAEAEAAEEEAPPPVTITVDTHIEEAPLLMTMPLLGEE